MNVHQLINELEEAADRVKDLRSDGWVPAVERPLMDIEKAIRVLIVDLKIGIR